MSRGLRGGGSAKRPRLATRREGGQKSQKNGYVVSGWPLKKNFWLIFRVSFLISRSAIRPLVVPGFSRRTLYPFLLSSYVVCVHGGLPDFPLKVTIKCLILRK